jgi:hypothetical protein
MSKKFDNKILLYILGALIIVFGAVKLYQKKYTENTLNPKIVDIDTAKVTKLLLYPTSEKRAEIKFYKEGKEWEISKDKLIAEPEGNVVQNLLGMLLEIKVQRLAARGKSKMAELLLNDTSATRVKVYQGDKLALDLLIGKFSYQKGNNPYSGMYGGGTGTSYVRLADKEEAYAVEGFLTFSFNQQFNSFRKQTLARFDKPSATKITFKYPADSSFVVELKDKQWMIGSEKADSAKVADYLNSLAYKNASSFNDNFVPSGASQCQLTVEGNNMKTITIDAYFLMNDNYILNSNQNPKSYFSSPNKGLLSEVFKGKKTFFGDDKKSKKKK